MNDREFRCHICDDPEGRDHDDPRMCIEFLKKRHATMELEIVDLKYRDVAYRSILRDVQDMIQMMKEWGITAPVKVICVIEKVRDRVGKALGSEDQDDVV